MTDHEQPPVDKPDTSEARTAPSLVLVNTGAGKGKSTAAFGTALRALALGWPVAVVQFLKSGGWQVGEERICRELGVDWFAGGVGQSGQSHLPVKRQAFGFHSRVGEDDEPAGGGGGDIQSGRHPVCQGSGSVRQRQLAVVGFGDQAGLAGADQPDHLFQVGQFGFELVGGETGRIGVHTVESIGRV